jgi:hypothetical protein
MSAKLQKVKTTKGIQASSQAVLPCTRCPTTPFTVVLALIVLIVLMMMVSETFCLAEWPGEYNPIFRAFSLSSNILQYHVPSEVLLLSSLKPLPNPTLPIRAPISLRVHHQQACSVYRRLCAGWDRQPLEHHADGQHCRAFSAAR